MKLVFPKLEPWQEDVFQDIKDAYKTGKIFTVKSKRQVGKTTLMCVILIYYAVQHPGCRSIVIEPSNNNNRKIYKDIKKWLQNTRLCKKFNDSFYEIEFNNGSILCFKSAEARDNLRGDNTNGILCIDEAQFIHQEILQVVMPYVDAANAPMLLISTPLFADPDNLYYKFFIGADNVQSFSYDWSKYDTSKYLTPKKMEFYRKTLTDFKFRTEILGEFISDAGYVFKNILKCILKKEKITNRNPIAAGIDFGTGSNGDYTVIVLFNSEKQMVDIQYVNDLEPTKQIDWLAGIINNYPTLQNVYAEKNSIGNVYISALKQKLRKKTILHEFITTNSTKKDIVEELVKAFSLGELSILDDDELIKQLQHFTVKKLQNGNYTYECIMPIHDDMVMATCIAWYALTGKKGNYSISFK